MLSNARSMPCLAPKPQGPAEGWEGHGQNSTVVQVQPAKCVLQCLRKRRGMVEIIISMVQSTVYKFLYLMKNKIIHLVHRARFYELFGGREHFIASYQKIQPTTVLVLFSFHMK